MTSAALLSCGLRNFQQSRRSARRQLRGAGSVRIDRQGQYLAHLVDRLDDTPSDDPDTAAYHELLDRALEDRRLTDTESEALAAAAAEWRLAADAVQLAHEQYFDSILRAVEADGVITELEHADLQLVASVLRLDPDIVQRRFDDSAPIELPATAYLPTGPVGLTLCFTGALVGRIDDQLITRDQTEALAGKQG